MRVPTSTRISSGRERVLMSVPTQKWTNQEQACITKLPLSSNPSHQHDSLPPLPPTRHERQRIREGVACAWDETFHQEPPKMQPKPGRGVPPPAGRPSLALLSFSQERDDSGPLPSRTVAGGISMSKTIASLTGLYLRLHVDALTYVVLPSVVTPCPSCTWPKQW